MILGSNTFTVAAVAFDRAVKFQFSSGAVEFDALSLNGVDSDVLLIQLQMNIPEHYVFLNAFPKSFKWDTYSLNQMIQLNFRN